MNVVKEYVLMTEMSCRPLSLESFSHTRFNYFNEQLPRVTTPQPEAGLG